MKALTRERLRGLRERLKHEYTRRKGGEGPTEVLVGKGSCGIAAGANATFAAIEDQIKHRGLEQVAVRQTGCMGLCASEPTVEVIRPGMPGVVYGHVDEALGRLIVDTHLLKGELLGEHIFDKPAADIVTR